jgi:hypothetical protein
LTGSAIGYAWFEALRELLLDRNFFVEGGVTDAALNSHDLIEERP